VPENIFGGLKKFSYLCTRKSQITCIRSGARVAEEARLESVYTPKAYRGFESPSLRKEHVERQRIEALIQRVLSFFSPGNDIKKNRKTAENSREKPKNAEVCTQHARKF
jgi:hypothetical protein